MKSFLNFLSEARKTKASERAKQLNLTGDGKGNWVDKAGNIVARTEDGELKFTKRKTSNQKEPETKEVKYSTPDKSTEKREKEKQPEQINRTNSDEIDVAEPGSKDGETITMVFGRFNPPTIGHKKVLDSAQQIAGGGDYRVYPSRSFDPKKNPLDPSKKVELMRKMFPKHEDAIINDESIRTIFDALKLADAEGYSDVNIIVGSDRVAEFDNLAQKYNGELYNFDNIEVISAGQRDDSEEGVTGMSASKMRKAAVENDFVTFRKGIPDNIDDKEAKIIMNTVRKAMKVATESWSLWEIAPKFDWKNLRENYINENIFNLNNLVESLNTGLIGKVIRRGTNYLICVTEDNIMFKSWIKDIQEYSEVKMSRKKRVPNKNNTLTGTDGYFKYVADMTPGFDKGEKNNLQPGGKAYKGPGYKRESFGEDFINKYRKKSSRLK